MSDTLQIPGAGARGFWRPCRWNPGRSRNRRLKLRLLLFIFATGFAFYHANLRRFRVSPTPTCVHTGQALRLPPTAGCAVGPTGVWRLALPPSRRRGAARGCASYTGKCLDISTTREDATSPTSRLGVAGYTRTARRLSNLAVYFGRLASVRGEAYSDFCRLTWGGSLQRGHRGSFQYSIPGRRAPPAALPAFALSSFPKYRGPVYLDGDPEGTITAPIERLPDGRRRRPQIMIPFAPDWGCYAPQESLYDLRRRARRRVRRRPLRFRNRTLAGLALRAPGRCPPGAVRTGNRDSSRPPFTPIRSASASGF